MQEATGVSRRARTDRFPCSWVSRGNRNHHGARAIGPSGIRGHSFDNAAVRKSFSAAELELEPIRLRHHKA